MDPLLEGASSSSATRDKPVWLSTERGAERGEGGGVERNDRGKARRNHEISLDLARTFNPLTRVKREGKGDTKRRGILIDHRLPGISFLSFGMIFALTAYIYYVQLYMRITRVFRKEKKKKDCENLRGRPLILIYDKRDIWSPSLFLGDRPAI